MSEFKKSFIGKTRRMSNKLFLLVALKDEGIDQKIKSQFPVLFSEPASLPTYIEYVLYFVEGAEEDSINEWCMNNLPQAWHVDPLY